jgi:hypothetical protein
VKSALALGGGGARHRAYRVIEALDELGCGRCGRRHFDRRVVGTSYAAGMSGRDMRAT